MTTTPGDSAVDVTVATPRRVSLPSTSTESVFSNQADPVVRSETAAAQPREARHRLIVMWAEAALRHASLQDIDDPAGVVATIAGIEGVWAQGSDARQAREELHETLIDWATLKMRKGDDDIPCIDGVSLNVRP